MAALRYIGCKVRPLDFHLFDPKWKFDIVKAANKLHPEYREWTRDTFWRAIERDFWAEVPQSQEFKTLLQLTGETVGWENTFILTCPTNDPECLAGKLEWIQLDCPPQLHRQYLMGPPKYLCAKRNTLLIDDSDANVDLFRSNGGQAILVPRPWNSEHRNEGIDQSAYLRQMFNQVFNGD